MRSRLEDLGLSARDDGNALRVGRTVADLEGSDEITVQRDGRDGQVDPIQ
jgi:predicted ATPase with chaperone activity